MSRQETSVPSPVTLSTLRKMKGEGRKFACLTAYDASFAQLIDESGAEVVLVGDSLGNVIQGHASTVPVTVDDVVYHTRTVARGRRRALLMADMPFMSFATVPSALENAARLMREGLAQMVKLEGGAAQVEIVHRLAEQGVPVCAHLGLRPQSVHRLGGFKVQGRGDAAARVMLDEAHRLEEAGAEILLLECVPSRLAREITESVAVPVIGIGAGPDCDGQILVLYDVLGITPGRRPRFSRDFLEEAGTVRGALEAYVRAVKTGEFPAPEHGFE
ncbi:MAG: 3-methyl-2-oxobutanoate hydroxymethyltransferase [Gammaproteobacteria bacterium]|nr:3-methyl-2-oxobutanoate hydroxymethyltransferase [Gammaproteobacteria bacterium]NIR88853.1 3-methyl-2-oxobutanoate hydroxymethyltransferase [Gammaproteobacteria bacterium]NIU06457.1 3-methyl-2-oxobutanoate hydroxymethyltransferase [Gammaproteobacteria bacterium]NIV53349.1 3-methyl-2-oxobutanoate hydroxymethyltransferase [Gammaproteobacteria bacterium]NIV74068.1 3-methyl-2-oxobutanoate hydroxymethyltransferase [Gammaproteobacteria bacterium]